MKVQVLAKKITTFFIQQPLLYVLLLWVSVIAITSPNFNRPLSKHHEFNPSLVLICIENWQAIGGPQNTNFTPLINYQNSTDKLPGFSTDKYNQFVNVSFGNLWYLAPYYFHQLLHLQPTAASLQVYNLLLLLISLLLVNKISEAIGNATQQSALQLLIPLIYATSPVVAWFCTNGYVHEVAVLPFYFCALLLLHNIFLNPSISVTKLLALSTLVFLGTLNDWLFAPLCAVASLYAIYYFINTKKAAWLAVVLACVIGFVAAIATILYGYSLQMGWQKLVNLSINRWQERGLTTSVSAFEIAKLLGRNYLMNYAGLLLIPIGICSKKISVPITKLLQNKSLLLLLIGSFCVGFIHQLLFLQFSYIHDYSVLKLALPLSIFTSLIIIQFKQTIRLLIVICVLISSIATYYYVNRPGQIAQNGNPYSYLQTLGKNISQTVANDEILVIKNLDLMPQLIYYTKRNYLSFEDETSCKAYMAKNGFKKACIITLNNWQIQSAKHIQL
ncbi:MAG: hypothetical protein QM541_12145 [Flavobacterium sp.]|nr:hypothetical protein [Flavobacterium sp.]